MKRVIRFGIIGCGLMGREFASAAARWLHLTDTKARPEIVAVCDTHTGLMDWFSSNLPTVKQTTTDYHALLANPDVDAVVFGNLGAGVGLDDIGPQFNGLTDEGQDFGDIAIHHITAFGVVLHDQRFDHKWHPHDLAFAFQAVHIAHTSPINLGLVRQGQQVDDDAGGIQHKALFDGAVDHFREQDGGQWRSIDIGDVGS